VIAANEYIELEIVIRSVAVFGLEHTPLTASITPGQDQTFEA